MTNSVLGKRKRNRANSVHPYLTGNFAPIHQTCHLTPCSYTGTIPDELLGGQYVRNGSNPVSNEDLGRDAHWFDGDGMLSGVLFKRETVNGSTIVQPEFVNQYILTDLFLSAATTPALRKPVLPSIATLVNPLSSILRITLSVLRAVFLVILSKFPGSKQSIKKISVANTSIMYHDGRALATCESGPPLRISLPSLDTVGWFNGIGAEGEPLEAHSEDEPLGRNGILSFMKEWTTAHPKVDPETNEMILFHSSFAPPYVEYSILPATQNSKIPGTTLARMVNKPVSGVSSAKMMHDFGVSKRHTVIMDLPLSLDPFMLAKNKAPISYDSKIPSRFGVFPRREPSNVRWFETKACCIFHTVNTWDEFDEEGELKSVDMLACRMTTASVVFSAGNIAAPQPTLETVKQVLSSVPPEASSENDLYEKGPCMESPDGERIPLLQGNIRAGAALSPDLGEREEEQCRLYYYSFAMKPTDRNEISHQFALSAIPFEFPSVRPDCQMSRARYVYGCTTTEGTFNSALGRNAKINAFVKFDATTLLARAKADPPKNVTGCLDTRTAKEIVASTVRGAATSDPDAIQIFEAPRGFYAQEPRFAASGAATRGDEDAGYLLAYMFDEAQLDANGQAPPSSVSELWVIDAKGMQDILAKVVLPQRVPYGLHGSWFPEHEVLGQRPVERVRSLPMYRREDGEEEREEAHSSISKMGRRITNALIRGIGG